LVTVDAAFFTEWRICQYVIESFSGIGNQAVISRDGRLAVHVADIVQEKIHQAETGGIRNDFPSGKGLYFRNSFWALSSL
jgi:hypothetical protein